MDNIDKLFLDNIYLVDGIINKLYYYNYLRDDLRQVALMGLFKAANRFNESFHVKFSTYATYFIIGEIKRELRENKLIKTGKKVTKVITLLRDNLTLKEIKERTKFNDDIIYTALMYKDNVKTYDIEYFDNINSLKDNEKLKADIELVLKGNYLKVIKYKYYFNLNQEEIGNLLGISQASVSRIEKRALEILKEVF